MSMELSYLEPVYDKTAIRVSTSATGISWRRGFLGMESGSELVVEGSCDSERLHKKCCPIFKWVYIEQCKASPHGR